MLSLLSIPISTDTFFDKESTSGDIFFIIPVKVWFIDEISIVVSCQVSIPNI